MGKARIGNRILNVNQNINVNLLKDHIIISGLKGSVKVSFDPKLINVLYKDNKIIVKRNNEEKFTKMIHGTINSLIENALIGVEKGHTKKLKITGIGYRANVDNDTVVLNLGYSHPINIKIPKEIKVEVNQGIVTISGANKETVGQLAAIIRSKRLPEPYKGKGVAYIDEVILRKAGKTAESSKK